MGGRRRSLAAPEHDFVHIISNGYQDDFVKEQQRKIDELKKIEVCMTLASTSHVDRQYPYDYLYFVFISGFDTTFIGQYDHT